MLRQFSITLALTVAVLAQDAGECTSERLPYTLPAGASPNGDMSDEKNRRSYNLQDDSEVKIAVSCYEGVSPEGDWPTLECQFQQEMKPCQHTEQHDLYSGLFIGHNDQADWAWVSGYDLDKPSPYYEVSDANGKTEPIDEQDTDPETDNPLSDKSGWIFVSADEKLEKDANGYIRGYMTVNMRRALTTSQPEYDLVIPVDKTDCFAYSVGSYYETYPDYDEVYGESVDGFMPNSACAGAEAKDSGMTLAAALGATMTALAILAF